MANRKLNTLWFIRLTNSKWEDVKVLLTAPNEQAARAQGLEFINPLYRADFKVALCEAVCQTPDTVLNFEPV